jgi:nucleotide-binding universal stress UspA family protein
MSWKSIFTVVTRTEGAAAALAPVAGFTLAADGHLDVLALGVDRVAPAYAVSVAGTAILRASIEAAEADARAIEAACRAALEAAPADLRWAVEAAVAPGGALASIIAQRARYADLVILPRPYGEGRMPEDAVIVEAALFEGQTPVLIVPDGQTSLAARRVLLAWNESREALRAARRALPLLARAEGVWVTVIDPPLYGPEADDPGGALCRMLVRHGVKAEVLVVPRTRPKVSETIAEKARDLGADLIVMGAYGHSRLREAILGGATRNMLEAAEVPVFLAH